MYLKISLQCAKIASHGVTHVANLETVEGCCCQVKRILTSHGDRFSPLLLFKSNK